MTLIEQPMVTIIRFLAKAESRAAYGEAIHYGAWNARALEGMGEIAKVEADELVKVARIRRRLARGKNP